MKQKESVTFDAKRIGIVRSELIEEAARRLRMKEESQEAIDQVKKALQEHSLMEEKRFMTL